MGLKKFMKRNKIINIINKEIEKNIFLKRFFKKSINYQFTRFLIVGIINTLGSYFLYVVLLLLFNYLTSYFISTIIFILISSYLNTSFVFRIDTNKLTLFSFFCLLIFQMIIGAMIIRYSIETLRIPEILAPLINIFLLTPLKYLASKFMKKVFN